MKKTEFIKVHETWVPFIIKLRSEIDLIDSLWDREKAVVLLIVAAYFLNKEGTKKKDAQMLMSLCMDTIYATPLE
jgi:hypothetical protein